MRKVLLFLILPLFMASCKVMSNKQYERIVSQKDSLDLGWKNAQTRIDDLNETIFRLKADTAFLHGQIADLNAKITGLNSNNANLRATSSRLSSNLKEREAKLKEVEESLRKRDAATQALKTKLQEALLGFQQSGLSVDVRDGKVYVSLTDKLLFPSGSIIIDEKGKQALAGLATVLKSQPDINISVEGHTDNQKVINLGQIKDNWDLSVLRATSVARFLADAQQIEPARITATGKSQYQPVDPASTPEARSHNRRIEVVLTPKLDELYNLIK